MELLSCCYSCCDPPFDPVTPPLTSDATFQINSAKLYILAVTLSIHRNMKCLENMKHGFKEKSKKRDQNFFREV